MDEKAFFQANDFLWAENLRLQKENRQLQTEVTRLQGAQERLAETEAILQQLQEQNAALRRQLQEAASASAVVPVFKANVPRRPSGKRPGCKVGHAAALRPMPATVEQHQQVPLGVDGFGKACCPECHSQLAKVRQHERLVEEILPGRPVTICYHTTSGWCPSCRKSIESRAPEQPPACNLPHAQLGLNALVTAALLRVSCRLPFARITRLLGQLPGICASAPRASPGRSSVWAGCSRDSRSGSSRRRV